MTSSRLGCAPNVVWSVERRGVRLLNTLSRAEQVVPYPQAAIWDLVCRQAQHIPEKIAAISGLSPVEASHIVSETTGQWVRDGFLTEEER